MAAERAVLLCFAAVIHEAVQEGVGRGGGVGSRFVGRGGGGDCFWRLLVALVCKVGIFVKERRRILGGTRLPRNLIMGVRARRMRVGCIVEGGEVSRG